MQYTHYFEQLKITIPLLMEEHHVPGLSIAVVNKEKVLFSDSYGYTDSSKTTHITTTTPFSVQSVSKTYTAFGFMLAVQDGKVLLDDPLKKYVPAFSTKHKDGQDYSYEITFRHLLKHRSGLAHEAPIGNNFVYGAFEEHIRSINDTYLRFKPDEQYSYSNLGMDLVAYALEQIYSRPFDEYMKEKVFIPLEMTSSTFNQVEFLERMDSAVGHDKTSLPKHPISMLGAGGMYSCANDMARFVICFLNQGVYNGKKIMNQDLIRRMYNESPISDSWTYHLGMEAGFWNKKVMLNHNGGGFGFYATQDILPENGFGAVALTNSVNHPNIQRGIVRNIWDDFFEMQDSGFEDCRPLNEVYTQYVGVYEATYNGGVWKLAVYPRNGKLYCNNQELIGYEPGLFFTKANDCIQFDHGRLAYNYVSLKKRTE
ncbi:serine hydrolase domain-containing protein [Paenibacillus ginsengarvi]|uniref:Class A beta-lactamase-related serine hydrolase n=1 Tax=Paenibacillus ginsengarvi TaxID=400777 RepID=A0A3B0C7B9_9BACL|nr:serine hydrolase domain-containing protein [Paenibacillus ginsengarvi]RKN79247.1 class A beta-lactamase-related serine hydrolase [Paenibacillus ginsengarvi]